MEQKQTRDLLIRNIPIETQESIIALNNGLTISRQRFKKPQPFDWGKKISNEFIQKAIDQGRP